MDFHALPCGPAASLPIRASSVRHAPKGQGNCVGCHLEDLRVEEASWMSTVGLKYSNSHFANRWCQHSRHYLQQRETHALQLREAAGLRTAPCGTSVGSFPSPNHPDHHSLYFEGFASLAFSFFFELHHIQPPKISALPNSIGARFSHPAPKV